MSFFVCPVVLELLPALYPIPTIRTRRKIYLKRLSAPFFRRLYLLVPEHELLYYYLEFIFAQDFLNENVIK